MPIRGTIVKRIKTPKPRGTSDSSRRNAAKEVAANMEKYIKDKANRAYPPPSAPGQYPKRRTGEFVDGVNVTGTEKYITIASEAPHGPILNSGSRNMAARPWAEKAENARDWKDSVRKRAKKAESKKKKKGKKQ